MKTNNHSDACPFQLATDLIINALEQGTIPWQIPWKGACMPHNFYTGNEYQGINRLLLLLCRYEQNIFLTPEQVNHIGHVNVGEQPHLIINVERTTIENTETFENKVIDVIKSSSVFNVAQCEGFNVTIDSEKMRNTVPTGESIVENMRNKPVIYHKGEDCLYDPFLDIVMLPDPKHFERIDLYYQALFRELVHATGHSNRCQRRELLFLKELSHDPYSIEELIAEIGASYLSSLCWYDHAPQKKRDEYLIGWIEKLKSDNRLIFRACNEAQKATHCILNLIKEMNQEFEVPIEKQFMDN
jgi:antirestriction protein ArdC